MNALENQGFAVESLLAVEEPDLSRRSGPGLPPRSSAELPNLSAGLIHGGAGVVDEFGVV